MNKRLAVGWLLVSLVLFTFAIFGLPTEQPSTHQFNWLFAALGIVALLAAVGSWRRVSKA